MKLFKKKVYDVDGSIMYVSRKTYNNIKSIPRCKFYQCVECKDKSNCREGKCLHYDCAILEKLIEGEV